MTGRLTEAQRRQLDGWLGDWHLVADHTWPRIVLRLEHFSQALGTMVWSHGIGDLDFEERGRGMLARLVD